MEIINTQAEEGYQPSAHALYQRARYQRLIESQRVYHREYKQQFTNTYKTCEVCNREISVLNFKRHCGTKKHIALAKLNE